MGEEKLKDERWRIYKDRFHTLPIFCFNTLKYPESFEEAKLELSRLDLDQTNINSQFQERKTELESAHPFDQETFSKDYNTWKVKALRAQRMTLSQIRIIEAWMLDNPSSDENRISLLEDRIKNLEKRIVEVELHIQNLAPAD